MEFFCGKGASLVYGEDGNYRTGTVPMFKDGKIINVDCSKAIDMRNLNGYIIMTSDTQVSGNIQNYSNIDTLNIADNSYASITNHEGYNIKTINIGIGSRANIDLGNGSKTTVNNRGFIDTLTTGKNSSLLLYNYGEINAVNIGEDGTADIYNYNYIYEITGGNISNKDSLLGINVTNYGHIVRIQTGAYSTNEVFNYGEGYVDWLVTGYGNSSTTDGGTKKVSGEGNIYAKFKTEATVTCANKTYYHVKEILKDPANSENFLLIQTDGKKIIITKDMLDKGLRYRAKEGGEGGILPNEKYKKNIKDIKLTDEMKKAGVKIVTKNDVQYYDFTEVIKEMLTNNAEICKEHRPKMSGTQMLSNAAIALQWFHNKVNHNADWDIKMPKHWIEQFPALKDFDVKDDKNNFNKFIFEGELITAEDLGNITYGYFGRSMGFGDTLLYAGGGYAAVGNNADDKRVYDPSAYYGDTKQDHNMIEKGIDLYNAYYQGDKPVFDPNINTIKILFKGYDIIK